MNKCLLMESISKATTQNYHLDPIKVTDVAPAILVSTCHICFYLRKK